MKRKALMILFLLNTLMIMGLYTPFMQEMVHNNNEAASIGIIGGVDGPTAIFIASKISWFPVALISIEIILGLY